ncbi:MAG: hypothetical protein ACRD0K_28200 [Egibacteraceae bacterium]
MWVDWWLAGELAAKGDERDFDEATRSADRLTGVAGHQDDRGFFARFFGFRPVQQASLNRGCHLVLLGQADDAVEAFQAGLVDDGWGVGWTVIALVDIAAARVLQGEPEEACQGLTRALDLALDAGYPTGVRRIRGVRARFDPAWADLPCVRQLDERLRLAA